MNEVMNEITEELIDDLSDKKIKQVVLTHKERLSASQQLSIEAIKRIKNPFTMIGVPYVMRDLKIGENMAYNIFKRPDFPAITIGKRKQVMFLAYLIWKCERRG